MIPLVVVRPEPGAATTLAAAHALGLEASAHPIFAVRPTPWDAVPRAAVDALVLGSANALRHVGPGLDALRGLPAYCVGRTTAEVAEASGFAIAAIGSGGLQNVVPLLQPGHRRLLRLAGAAHVPLSLPLGVTMETRCVYEGVALPMPASLMQALRAPTVVMLHSGEAASHFDALCAGAGIARADIALALIGPRLAPLAGSGWAAVSIAERPSDAALLALAREMCQNAAGAPKSPAERPDAGR